MVGQLGMGTMLKMLTDDRVETVEAVAHSIGKLIKTVQIDDAANMGNGELRFTFADGSLLRIWDSAQSCCETRYIHTDDDLTQYAGTIFTNIDVKENNVETESEYGDCHESMFMHVQTSKGVFTVQTHNIHNGYYGGFWLEASATEAT